MKIKFTPIAYIYFGLWVHWNCTHKLRHFCVRDKLLLRILKLETIDSIEFDSDSWHLNASAIIIDWMKIHSNSSNCSKRKKNVAIRVKKKKTTALPPKVNFSFFAGFYEDIFFHHPAEECLLP